jgi:hypothetical protein
LVFPRIRDTVGFANVGYPNDQESLMRDTDLDLQLRDLLDRQAITDLVAGLGLWLDEKRWGDAASILTADVTVRTPGGTAGGIDRVADQARRNHEGDVSQHVITNVLVELAGDRATARANLIATFAEPGSEPNYTVGEQYRFEAARTPRGWRLARVEVVPVWRRGARPVAAVPAG